MLSSRLAPRCLIDARTYLSATERHQLLAGARRRLGVNFLITISQLPYAPRTHPPFPLVYLATPEDLYQTRATNSAVAMPDGRDRKWRKASRRFWTFWETFDCIACIVSVLFVSLHNAVRARYVVERQTSAPLFIEREFSEF